MSGGLNFTTEKSANCLTFSNSEAKDQISTIKVLRPPGADDSGSGIGGLNIDLAGASDSNRLRIRGGSGFGRDILDVTAVSNAKAIKIYSAVQLAAGNATEQTIWAKSGFVGNLSYAGVNENNIRLSWGSNKVWIKNAVLDMEGNRIEDIANPTDSKDAVNKSYLEPTAG